MAEEIGLRSSVNLVGNMSHKDAMELLLASDVAFYTLQKGYSQASHAIASKVYEYIGCKLPILAVADPGSAISELISSQCIGISVGWDELERMEPALRELLDREDFSKNLEANHAYFLDIFDRNRGIDLLYEELIKLHGA
jgi:hypothetical protein